jgi:hypothetical protein
MHRQHLQTIGESWAWFLGNYLIIRLVLQNSSEKRRIKLNDKDRGRRDAAMSILTSVFGCVLSAELRRSQRLP